MNLILESKTLFLALVHVYNSNTVGKKKISIEDRGDKSYLRFFFMLKWCMMSLIYLPLMITHKSISLCKTTWLINNERWKYFLSLTVIYTWRNATGKSSSSSGCTIDKRLNCSREFRNKKNQNFDALVKIYIDYLIIIVLKFGYSQFKSIHT